MSKYVPDISSRRWVIIAPIRSVRPNDNEKKNKRKICPFCPGHEKETPNEVFRIGRGEKNQKGWKVRVVANRYPITDLHEVVIHSADCKSDLKDLPVSQFGLILQAYKERFNFYRKKGQVLIFCNHGEHAGASIEHSHSQLVVIPFQINLDALIKEPLNNVIDENKYFNVYCPDFSQWPYEVWIAPKKDGTFFGDILDAETADLADILKKILVRLNVIHEHGEFGTPFGYNFYINPKENWYLRIIPRFIHRAGFELGTGLSVNVTDPIDAALAFKGVDVKMKNVLSRLQKHF